MSEPTIEPLSRRLDATGADLERARDAAWAIAAEILGRDPGPLTIAASMSHYVFIAADIVVKLVDAHGHTRLDREIAIAPQLPAGLGAPLLASGERALGDCDVRFACFTRIPGASPGVDLPDIDAVTARRLAVQAVGLLSQLHGWRPTGDAEAAVRTSERHEGFTGRAALIAEIGGLDGRVPPHLIHGLTAIAQRAPELPRSDVPVHADADWGNWLADEHGTLTLLDFERVRYGEPADDWVLLALTSGVHLHTVLDVIAEATATPPGVLHADCELRHAAFLAEGIRFGLDQAETPAWLSQCLLDLDRLVAGVRWPKR